MSLETCPKKKPLSFLICESKDNHILERCRMVSSPCYYHEANLDDPLVVKCFCFALTSVAVAILVQGPTTVTTVMNLDLSEANDCR